MAKCHSLARFEWGGQIFASLGVPHRRPEASRMRLHRDEKLTKVAGGQTRNYIAGIEYLGANLDEISSATGSKPGRSGYVCLVTTPSRAEFDDK